jgi:hypothetical protein
LCLGSFVPIQSWKKEHHGERAAAGRHACRLWLHDWDATRRAYIWPYCSLSLLLDNKPRLNVRSAGSAASFPLIFLSPARLHQKRYCIYTLYIHWVHGRPSARRHHSSLHLISEPRYFVIGFVQWSYLEHNGTTLGKVNSIRNFRSVPSLSPPILVAVLLVDVVVILVVLA